MLLADWLAKFMFSRVGLVVVVILGCLVFNQIREHKLNGVIEHVTTELQQCTVENSDMLVTQMNLQGALEIQNQKVREFERKSQEKAAGARQVVVNLKPKAPTKPLVENKEVEGVNQWLSDLY